VTFRYDTASFPAADQLEKCLRLGFEDVVELGRPHASGPAANTQTPNGRTS
jgi:hypothetical protein